ncbi:MAG: alpha/beta fold hydrolase [Planctomycetaceae bacterium]|nr:alpha/beta fold hydrolase [Planctomycetaceae bacterium]MBT6484177.1 alpha/beta fold hydrolase [Planctomycetaceae bacterium]MBT6496562.1 alpha/beta fold hydrolase [Planctomycetaceae bacterium]
MYAKIRGTEIFYDIDGMRLVPVNGELVERPCLFLLHGGPGGDHAGFKTTPAALSDTAQLVYVDHRGSGRSRDSDPDSWTLENNIDDLDALREHFGLERISILGSSYGGMVALGYAIRYPDRVANLILVATAPSFRFMEDAKRIVEERGTPEQIEVCRRLWDGTFESLDQLKEYYRLMAPQYATSFDPEKFEENWSLGIRNFDQLNRGFAGFLRTFDYTEQLSAITCPTLVMAGAHDWICPPNHSRLIAERIPRAHLKIFAHSSHSIAADEPDAFLAAVRGFLTYAEAE